MMWCFIRKKTTETEQNKKRDLFACEGSSSLSASGVLVIGEGGGFLDWGIQSFDLVTRAKNLIL